MAEIGVPDACPSPNPPARRRIGHVIGPPHISKSGLNYEPVHSESDEMSDFELSEVEDNSRPVNKSPPPPQTIRKARVGVSFDPKGRMNSKKKKKNKGELDDDTEICL